VPKTDMGDRLWMKPINNIFLIPPINRSGSKILQAAVTAINPLTWFIPPFYGAIILIGLWIGWGFFYSRVWYKNQPEIPTSRIVRNALVLAMLTTALVVFVLNLLLLMIYQRVA
jgi:hypothetical protein